MFLNADIVFDNLPSEMGAHMGGTKVLELSLRRPQLYEGHDESFEANRLYLVHASHVPPRAHAERGCVIVCIGESPRLERYRQRCCVITLAGTVDFYHAFNVIQGIFDSYDAWENQLNEIVDEAGDIARMLTCSERIFRNPLYAIDSQFRMLGVSAQAQALSADANVGPGDGNSLRVGAFDQFLSLHDISFDETEPLVLTLLDQTTLNFNLHNADGYQGCVTVHYTNEPYRPSDKPLIAFLGATVLRAMHQLAQEAPDGLGSLRQAMQNLIEERPLDTLERDVVSSAKNGDRFVCMRLKLSNQLEQLPLGFVRNALEDAFPQIIVFDYHRNSVVAIIDVDKLDGAPYREAIAEAIEPFTGTMEMKAGISTPHDDLVRARHLFLQANAALDLGMLLDPTARMYLFEDYVLRHLAMKAVGDMPIDLLSPEGLRKLVSHDAESQTSYVQTLRLFLENNMSVAKTASLLYVHRSTLIERLARIKRELGVDLDDPDMRLQLLLLLKAMEIREQLRS